MPRQVVPATTSNDSDNVKDKGGVNVHGAVNDDVDAHDVWEFSTEQDVL